MGYYYIRRKSHSRPVGEECGTYRSPNSGGSVMLRSFFQGMASFVLVIAFFWGGLWLSLDSIFPRVEVTRSWPSYQVVRVRVVEDDRWVTKPADWLRTYDGPVDYIWGPSVPQLAAVE